MNKEILDTLDDLSKRPTTELAMRLMEATADNMAKDKELERYKNIVDELEKYLKEVPNNNADNIQYGRESLAEDLKDLIKKLKGE